MYVFILQSESQSIQEYTLHGRRFPNRKSNAISEENMFLLKLIIIAVTWTLVDPVIVFNDTVQLRCNVERVLKSSVSNVTKWKKSNNIIVFNGKSSNKLKYEQSNEEKSFTLAIKEFNLTDVNASYTCVYGFYSYVNVLTITEATSYELQPTPNSITRYHGTHYSGTGLYVLFAAVYPLPFCTLFDVENNISMTGLEIFPKAKDIFFQVAVVQTNNSKHIDCDEEFLLSCKVGRQSHDIMTLKNDESICTVHVPQVNPCIDCFNMIAGSVSVVLNGILVILLVLTKRLPPNYCRISLCDSKICDKGESYLNIFGEDCCRNRRRNEAVSIDKQEHDPLH